MDLLEKIFGFDIKIMAFGLFNVISYIGIAFFSYKLVMGTINYFNADDQQEIKTAKVQIKYSLFALLIFIVSYTAIKIILKGLVGLSV